MTTASKRSNAADSIGTEREGEEGEGEGEETREEMGREREGKGVGAPALKGMEIN